MWDKHNITNITMAESRICMERRNYKARFREASLVQVILTQFRWSPREPVEDDDDGDTMLLDDHDQ